MIGLDVKHMAKRLGKEYVGYSDVLKKGTIFRWKSLLPGANTVRRILILL